jgi:flagellar protein FliO/FliZ
MWLSRRRDHSFVSNLEKCAIQPFPRMACLPGKVLANGELGRFCRGRLPAGYPVWLARPEEREGPPMFEALGVELPLGLLGRFVVAFVIVLVLIGATFWLIRRFGNRRGTTGAARGRQPRLGVIDVAEFEGRRLVLIRRDNVEHLILLGNSGDLVVEQNIVRAAPLAREMPVPRAPGMAEAMTRTAEPSAARGSDFGSQWPEPGTRPEPVARPEPGKRTEPAMRTEYAKRVEPSMRGEPRLDGRNEPVVRTPRVTEPKSPPAAEPAPRPQTETELPLGRSGPASNAMPRVVTEPIPVVEPRAPATNEMELSDMAQRLETALRRPGSAQEERPEPAKPMSAPAAESRSAPPFAPPPRDAARPETNRSSPGERPPPVEPSTRPTPSAPQFGSPQTRGDPSRPPGENPRAAPAEPKPASPKTVFDSLEQEMASLLGRPAGKE